MANTQTDNSNIVAEPLKELFNSNPFYNYENCEDEKRAWNYGANAGANWQKEQLQPLIDSHRELLEALGIVIEYTFAFESDYEKCLEHIRKISQSAIQKANNIKP